MTKKKYIVVGGGIAGLLSAYFLKVRHPESDVTIFERDTHCGGLSKSFHYTNGEGLFDYGVRTINDSGNAELDQIIKSFIPKDAWIELPGLMKDFGGSYYRGKLQINSPFPDLRSFPKEEMKEFIEDFFSNLDKKDETKQETVYDYLIAKYGSKITERVFRPIFSKVYPFGLENSYYFIARLTRFDRVVLLEDSEINSASIRKSIAFTDQLKLPKEFISNSSSWYPKEYGMSKYIDAVVEKLTSMGVQIFNNSQVLSVENTKGGLTTVGVKIGNENKFVNEVDEVIWTSGLVPCYFTLFPKNINKFNFDKPIKTYFVNIGLDSEPNVSGLYWIYCLEKEFITYRIACPGSYCPDSYKDGIHRISIEIMIDDVSDGERIVNRVKDEVVKMGLTQPQNILFAHLETTSGGYPTLSIKNVKNLRAMLDEIKTNHGDYLKIFGAWTKPDLFSQIDILNDIYKSIL